MMKMIVGKFPGTFAIHEDMTVYTENDEDHNAILQNLMALAAKNGLVFNSSKCKIMKPIITFSVC